MHRVPKIALATALIVAAPALFAQQRVPTPPESALPMPPYAGYADLVVDAPLIIDATVRSTVRLKPAESVGVAPGKTRLYVEADVAALIRGSTAIPTRIGYVVDVPLDAQGKPPKLRKARVLLFARGVRGNAGQIQLVRPDAQRGWTPGGEALTRRIVRETLAPDAPPVVTGVNNAFHTVGNLPGESETQVFLTTASGAPVSLSIIRKPGEARRWSVSLSEVVDEAAVPPARDTLLWYRLACALPPALPPGINASSGEDASAAEDDYRFVIRALGPCDRGDAL